MTRYISFNVHKFIHSLLCCVKTVKSATRFNSSTKWRSNTILRHFQRVYILHDLKCRYILRSSELFRVVDLRLYTNVSEEYVASISVSNPEDRHNMILRNTGTYPDDYTAQTPRRPQCKHLSSSFFTIYPAPPFNTLLYSPLSPLKRSAVHSKGRQHILHLPLFLSDHFS